MSTSGQYPSEFSLLEEKYRRLLGDSVNVRFYCSYLELLEQRCGTDIVRIEDGVRIALDRAQEGVILLEKSLRQGTQVMEAFGADVPASLPPETKSTASATDSPMSDKLGRLLNIARSFEERCKETLRVDTVYQTVITNVMAKVDSALWDMVLRLDTLEKKMILQESWLREKIGYARKRQNAVMEHVKSAVMNGVVNHRLNSIDDLERILRECTAGIKGGVELRFIGEGANPAPPVDLLLQPGIPIIEIGDKSYAIFCYANGIVINEKHRSV